MAKLDRDSLKKIVISSQPYELLIRQASQILQDWTEPDATAKLHRSKPNE
ncbi:MAG: hypothetical protein Q4D85_11650 [Corynebacterium sp.]|nr:hypothetical protein [Corynebacterium sp.]MDO5099390.1 hypothetical protein [Corynebacterium sp.]